MKLKIKQCCLCNKAKNGENLYKFENNYYCAICLVPHLMNCGYFEIKNSGQVGDIEESQNELGKNGRRNHSL